MTGGGVHYSFEALGAKTTAEQAFGLLRPGGTATITCRASCHYGGRAGSSSTT
jgi:hypothetical protein